MRRYSLLFICTICLLSVFLLTSCGKQENASKKDVSVSKKVDKDDKDKKIIDDFISIGRKYGYKPLEETELPKEQLEEMKQKIEQVTKKGQIKIATVVNVSDIKNEDTVNNKSISIVMFNICQYEEIANGFKDSMKLIFGDVNKIGKMKGKCTISEHPKQNGVSETVLCADLGEDMKMFTISYIREKQVVYIQHVGKDRENLDKFLNEIGF